MQKCRGSLTGYFFHLPVLDPELLVPLTVYLFSGLAQFWSAYFLPARQVYPASLVKNLNRLKSQSSKK
ncbi:MAG: hypothetical protein BGO39_08310 [Chloroflexi bacterium 54-19]|nr:MAG: hypothetical protein BGO39_08310 [Chloroflexi bacterium 54-19]